MDKITLIEKLGKIQSELKAPKGQTNTFGKYKYRSCEDILEAVKPLLDKYKVVLTIKDNLVLIGERYYIQATSTLVDGTDVISATAYARESLTKKGMDDSQITGAASSYARKYSLNGLLLIDDTKDADTDESGTGDVKPPNPEPAKSEVKKVTGSQKAFIYGALNVLDIENITKFPSGDNDYIPVAETLKKENIASVEDLTFDLADRLGRFLNKKVEEIDKK